MASSIAQRNQRTHRIYLSNEIWQFLFHHWDAFMSFLSEFIKEQNQAYKEYSKEKVMLETATVAGIGLFVKAHATGLALTGAGALGTVGAIAEVDRQVHGTRTAVRGTSIKPNGDIIDSGDDVDAKRFELMNAEKEELVEHIIDLKKENKSLKSKVSELTQEVKRLNARVDTLVEENQSLRADVRELIMVLRGGPVQAPPIPQQMPALQPGQANLMQRQGMFRATPTPPMTSSSISIPTSSDDSYEHIPSNGHGSTI